MGLKSFLECDLGWWMMLSVKSTGLDQRNITLEWDTFVKEMLSPKGLFKIFDEIFNQSFFDSYFSNVKTINRFQIKFRWKWSQRIRWYDWWSWFGRSGCFISNTHNEQRFPLKQKGKLLLETGWLLLAHNLLTVQANNNLS